jgi:DNA-binding response OmpR family regulator/HPt (histidine-containing phosphotransfer) domain-containing protein
MRVLLVEDDESIVEIVTATLQQQNYVVDVAADGEAGWELLETFPYDLVLLDILLPKLDGISLCRRLRHRQKQILVMLLTAQDSTTDKLLGLDGGADDYVVKPFDIQELAARVRALLRRGNVLSAPVLSCGGLQLDPSTCEVTYRGQPLRFSRKEYLLLELFLRHLNRVFSRSAIVDQIWSFDEDPPNEDTVKSHIKSIRRKLDAVGAGDVIETLYGQGYRLNSANLAESNSADAAGEQEQSLKLSVANIWQRTRGTSLQRVVFLEQVVQALKLNTLDRVLQQQAVQTVHKLAGSLGTFGFDAGSQLAYQLEVLLQREFGQLSTTAQQQTAEQITSLIAALRDLVDQEVQSEPLAASASLSHLATSASETAPLLLICDQDPNLADAIMSQTHGLRVTVAPTLALAQKQCQQERPDIALIDLSLLRTKKSHLLLTTLQKQPSVPIVLLSAADSSQDRLEAVSAGGQLFLKKPASVSTILQAVQDLLHPPLVVHPRILVVDDDPLIAQVLSSHLKPQGIQALGLTDPTQFWETLNTTKPDLLILDLNTPVINGIELCQTVRCDLQWSWLPIIFLTVQPDRHIQQQIFLAGADDLITKPIELAELSTRILNRLRRSQSWKSSRTTSIATMV